MLSVTARALAAAGGRQEQARQRTQRQLQGDQRRHHSSTSSAQRTQPSARCGPSSMQAAAASSTVINSSSRRSGGASGSCGAGKVDHDAFGHQRDECQREHQRGRDVGRGRIRPRLAVRGHSSRIASQTSSAPSGTMRACPCRATKPGSLIDQRG